MSVFETLNQVLFGQKPVMVFIKLLEQLLLIFHVRWVDQLVDHESEDHLLKLESRIEGGQVVHDPQLDVILDYVHLLSSLDPWVLDGL